MKNDLDDATNAGGMTFMFQRTKNNLFISKEVPVKTSNSLCEAKNSQNKHLQYCHVPWVSTFACSDATEDISKLL